MKKLILLAAVAVFGLSNVNAQNFNVGISGGLPIGDADDIATFSIVLDANYLWEVSEEFDVGIASGYSHSFGESIDTPIGSFDIDDTGFLPIAAAARFNVSEEFILGADLGYAIGTSPSDNDGGFYYAPKVQYGVSEELDIVAAFRGVSLDGGSFDMITLGVEYKF